MRSAEEDTKQNLYCHLLCSTVLQRFKTFLGSDEATVPLSACLRISQSFFVNVDARQKLHVNVIFSQAGSQDY